MVEIPVFGDYSEKVAIVTENMVVSNFISYIAAKFSQWMLFLFSVLICNGPAYYYLCLTELLLYNVALYMLFHGRNDMKRIKKYVFFN